MRIQRRCAVLVLLALLFCNGCSRPADPCGPTLSRVEASTPEAYRELWDAAASTLRHQFFRLDRQDRTEGILTTVPETSASAFELWRPQPEPAYYWLESNLSTIQRQATVRFRPAEDGGYEVEVEVQRLRYILPERQVDNSAAALRLYSSLAPTESGQIERASETARWLPLGRDEPYEQRLLARILKRYGGGGVTTEFETVTTQPEETATPSQDSATP
jgi:hypothetical protein